ncbi:mitochondrial amino-acid acetyltransferase [Echria macrotheca]|uniref:Amino-acid acetyltransferase, mitochondrial n=1 Tax=Echria macrotheca TaxID=438768 RepID=A0AAJ0BLP5_9PEZI|nr:mitochondrial amino-acid acetyltransferase [Echria macrotheca]
MFARKSVWKKATSAAQASIRNEKRPKCRSCTTPSQRRCLSSENAATIRSPSPAEVKHKRESDREFLISVLESTATKRDAKAYLQTFGGKPDGIRAVQETPRFIQGPAKETSFDASETPHIAIVKLKSPQEWDDALVDGVAKTLTQLRGLGLLSVIVVDCAGASRTEVSRQTGRILKATGRHASPGAHLVTSALCSSGDTQEPKPSLTMGRVFVGLEESLTAPLRHGHMVVVPCYAYSEDTLRLIPVDPDEVVLAMTTFFSGLQFHGQEPGRKQPAEEDKNRPFRRALVDRIIVIDPLGGIPSVQKNNGARVFINLEEEFARLQDTLRNENEEPAGPTSTVVGGTQTNHERNLRLVKSALAILPSTASAVITSPMEAANLRIPEIHGEGFVAGPVTGQVGTRRWQNPLIHNLLTDRPIYSSSLPIGRIKATSHDAKLTASRMPTTTLAKKGMPVTIFPDPRAAPWQPPKPGAPRLRLTDTCIDLPRLVHLINDSFSRTLDVEHYLNRVQDSLAGIIIAGEYEGGAILTWEKPFGMDEEMAYSQGRLVPYLDKFAVLKKSQGAGGVADIVFNAMVRDCFPGGVCWRSRKNNPVNKWYFERSAGVRKLPNSNWAMFWTNQDAALDETLMRDYEDVCRSVVPSWADGKQAD